MEKNGHISIINKIKNKFILIDQIQGFISHRHYILPYLTDKDKILQNKLSIFFKIPQKNDFSLNTKLGLYSFLSDIILYQIGKKENILDNSQYIKEYINDSLIKTYIERILYIYKRCKYSYFYNYNKSIIENITLEEYLPSNEDFILFIYDLLSKQKSFSININDITLTFLEFFSKNNLNNLEISLMVNLAANINWQKIPDIKIPNIIKIIFYLNKGKKSVKYENFVQFFKKIEKIVNKDKINTIEFEKIFFINKGCEYQDEIDIESPITNFIESYYIYKNQMQNPLNPLVQFKNIKNIIINDNKNLYQKINIEIGKNVKETILEEAFKLNDEKIFYLIGLNDIFSNFDLSLDLGIDELKMNNFKISQIENSINIDGKILYINYENNCPLKIEALIEILNKYKNYNNINILYIKNIPQFNLTDNSFSDLLNDIKKNILEKEKKFILNNIYSLIYENNNSSNSQISIILCNFLIKYMPNLKNGHIYKGYNKKDQLVYYQCSNYKISSGIMHNIIIKNCLYHLKLIKENISIYYENNKKSLLIKNLFTERDKENKENKKNNELDNSKIINFLKHANAYTLIHNLLKEEENKNKVIDNSKVSNFYKKGKANVYTCNKYYAPLSYFYYLIFKMNQKDLIKELDIEGFECMINEIDTSNISKLSINSNLKYFDDYIRYKIIFPDFRLTPNLKNLKDFIFNNNICTLFFYNNKRLFRHSYYYPDAYHIKYIKNELLKKNINFKMREII